MSKTNKLTRKACSRCEKEQAISSFYNTSDVEVFPDKKIPVCKTCCTELFDNQGFEGFKIIMRLINKPIYTELFKGDYGEYIKNVNSLPNYRGTSFEDSDMFKENKALESVKRAKPTELSEEDLRESEDFWGAGKSERDYIWLNTEFTDYLARYEVDGKTLEDLIVDICLTRLDIRKRREEGLDVDKQHKTLNDLLTAANLKPVQETGANALAQQETFGTLIKKWEDTRPIQDDSEWKKKDTIGQYLKVWFTGHLMRMFDIENKDEEEYYEELNKYTVALEVEEGEPDGRD